ncbi:MAG: MFS transporter [Dehalococcoidia bacterium]
MSAFYHFRQSSPAIQLLLINSFSINCGFYMLYPYLTVYFRDDLGFAAWAIGLILGIRVLSQQGMTIFGGTLADRVGYKFAILVGLTLRAAGFAALGLAESFPTVLAAAVVSGLGGAVFSPASRAYYSGSAKERRAEVFALDNAFSQAGALIGPLIGLALLAVSLRTVAITSASVFFTLMLFQSRFLPEVRPAAGMAMTSIRAGWGEVLHNRQFVLFAIAMFGQFTLINQLYLGLPLEIERLTGSQTGVSALFIISSVLTIVLQVQVTSFFKRRLRPPYAITAGLFVMGLAFLPALISASVLDSNDEAVNLFSAEGAVLLLPLLSAALLAFGVMIANPFALEMVPRLGRDGLTATYFGVYATASGIGATTGNVLTGIAFDQQDALGLPGLPWLFMILLGAFCAVFMFNLARSARFQAAAEAPPSPTTVSA